MSRIVDKLFPDDGKGPVVVEHRRWLALYSLCVLEIVYAGQLLRTLAREAETLEFCQADCWELVNLVSTIWKPARRVEEKEQVEDPNATTPSQPLMTFRQSAAACARVLRAVRSSPLPCTIAARAVHCGQIPARKLPRLAVPPASERVPELLLSNVVACLQVVQRVIRICINQGLRDWLVFRAVAIADRPAAAVQEEARAMVPQWMNVRLPFAKPGEFSSVLRDVLVAHLEVADAPSRVV